MESTNISWAEMYEDTTASNGLCLSGEFSQVRKAMQVVDFESWLVYKPKFAEVPEAQQVFFSGCLARLDTTMCTAQRHADVRPTLQSVHILLF
jgi:hypothetical protein